MTAGSLIAPQATEHHAVQSSASGDHHSSAVSAPETASPESDIDGDAASAPSEQAEKSAPSAKPVTPSKNSCSACAYCCLGAGMTAPQPTIPSAPSGSDALVVTDEAAPTGITVGGLERPPRLNFA